jgi:hypothetical protein
MFNFTLGNDKFLIEINYISGIQKRFWVYSFNMSNGNVNNCNYVSDLNRPIDIFAGDKYENKIESIYQIGYKRGLLSFLKGKNK